MAAHHFLRQHLLIPDNHFGEEFSPNSQSTVSVFLHSDTPRNKVHQIYND